MLNTLFPKFLIETVSCGRGKPKRLNTSYKRRVIIAVVAFGQEVAAIHLEKRTWTMLINLFPTVV